MSTAAAQAVKSWRVLDCRHSITEIGVVWPVEEDSGTRCGCGACKITSLVAFFVDRYDAEMYVADREEREEARRNRGEVLQ